MEPLILKDVAEAVEMHESTISRVTTAKYMHTPRGVFEFRYFFSSHVEAADGTEMSSIAIRAKIKKLISQENPDESVSDSQARGNSVARRHTGGQAHGCQISRRHADRPVQRTEASGCPRVVTVKEETCNSISAVIMWKSPPHCAPTC